MIEHIHIQELPCLDDGTRYGDVVGAGGRIPAGVIVNDDHGAGIAPDGWFEQLSDVHL